VEVPVDAEMVTHASPRTGSPKKEGR
jgi:hypothetical protein